MTSILLGEYPKVIDTEEGPIPVEMALAGVIRPPAGPTHG
jgi:hypothetical protein